MGYPSVHLNEEVMREGMQIESVDIPVKTKTALLQSLAECGLEAIDVGSFVSPRYTPQMARVEEVLRGFEPVEGTEYYALVMNQKGIDRASEFSWLSPFKAAPPQLRAHMCDTFVRRNMNRAQADEISAWETTVTEAKESGTEQAGMWLGAAWGSNFRGLITTSQRMSMFRRMHGLWDDAGIRVTWVGFADPMSWCMPHWVEETLNAVKSEWPEVCSVYQHLHDARGMALPSTYATIRNLDERFDVSFDVTAGGIGGCPYCGNGRVTGMAATEDVVMMCEAMGIKTGINLPRLIEFVHQLEVVIGRLTPGHVAKAGPLPLRQEDFYDPNLPLVETHEEAQHFRLGPEVVQHQIKPWRQPIPPINLSD